VVEQAVRDAARDNAISLSSTDGRSFRVRTGSDGGLRIGDYLTFDDGHGHDQLGFLEGVEHVTDGEIAAVGTIVRSAHTGPPEPFRSNDGARASSELVEDFLTGSSTSLPMGELVTDPSVTVGLTAARFNRHTFWCGQSGSGKTYALGVALEQVILKTRLPIVVFDPNSDFVRLNEALPDADATDSAALEARDVRILRPTGEGDALRARFRDLDPPAMAAVLRLDPVIDGAEYNSLLKLADRMQGNPEGLTQELRNSADPGAEALARRLENLGILDWQIWAYRRRAATDVVGERPAATVLDLGSLRRREEQLALALGVLEDLWQRREERRPVLLVLDEAHNLCAPDMESVVGRAVRDRIIQIAAEGRKYGLWLLLSTQRPSKIHSGILSQCDNLTLMRMNSPVDLAELGDVFGFVPPQMLAQSSRFRPGEALVAGGFVPAPSIIKVGRRLTVEGGIDVRVPMP
jgi:uncharacterized protein